jgi:hypothetical protein
MIENVGLILKSKHQHFHQTSNLAKQISFSDVGRNMAVVRE